MPSFSLSFLSGHTALTPYYTNMSNPHKHFATDIVKVQPDPRSVRIVVIIRPPN